MTHTITELKALRAAHGDLPVYVNNHGRLADPNPTVKDTGDDKRVEL